MYRKFGFKETWIGFGALAAVLLAVVFIGRVSQPQLSDEQIKAAKFLQENFDSRLYVINERLGKIEFQSEGDKFKWIRALLAMGTWYEAMRVEEGHEAAIAWYDAESRKPGEELLAKWGE